MKKIATRLCQLEARLIPQVDEVMRHWVEVARERRRRRLEAAGEPVDELDWASLSLPPGTRLSEAETARLARPLIWKRNRERAERKRLLAEGPLYGVEI